MTATVVPGRGFAIVEMWHARAARQVRERAIRTRLFPIYPTIRTRKSIDRARPCAERRPPATVVGPPAASEACAAHHHSDRFLVCRRLDRGLGNDRLREGFRMPARRRQWPR